LKYEKIAMSKKEAYSDEKPTDSQPGQAFCGLA